MLEYWFTWKLWDLRTLCSLGTSTDRGKDCYWKCPSLLLSLMSFRLTLFKATYSQQVKPLQLAKLPDLHVGQFGNACPAACPTPYTAYMCSFSCPWYLHHCLCCAGLLQQIKYLLNDVVPTWLGNTAMVAVHMLAHVFGSALVRASVLVGFPEAFVGLYSYTGTGKQKYKCGRQNPFISVLLLVQVSWAAEITEPIGPITGMASF